MLPNAIMCIICGGSFSGLEDIIMRRLGKSELGFLSSQNILKNPDEYRVGEPDLDNEDILDWNVFDEVTK